MDGYPKLDFPAPHLRVKRGADGSMYVWDALRGRFLVLTPEEWVRRHLIAWLVSYGVPERNVCQEYPVDMSGAAQRADVMPAVQAPGRAVAGQYDLAHVG